MQESASSVESIAREAIELKSIKPDNSRKIETTTQLLFCYRYPQVVPIGWILLRILSKPNMIILVVGAMITH